MAISFNKPYFSNKELAYMEQACRSGHVSGGGSFTQRCQSWIENRLGCSRALLTHSGTGALEMTAILADIQPGDEVIMPSYTFVSTANAFVLRGGIPVFVDIRPDTLNIDETKIEQAITSRTKAIVPVHYAGVGCNMERIAAIAQQHGLIVIEDAAHGFLATYKERYLGSLGHMAAFSFHETKNVISGEGGALIINDRRFAERAEIIWEKGTDRSKYFRGEVDKYTWVDVGSSFLPSDIIAAFLWAQLEEADDITAQRMHLWRYYHQAFAALERSRQLRRPCIPAECVHNAHMYYLLMPNAGRRDRFLLESKNRDIQSVFHYAPLHLSKAGARYARAQGDQFNTEDVASRLVRLPMWIGLSEAEADAVIETARSSLAPIE